MARKRTKPDDRVSLAVEGLLADLDVPPVVRAPALPWLAASLAGGLVCALAGWLLVVAPIGLAWLTSPAGSLSGALRLGTQFWLLAHGAGATLDKLQVTLVPLGITALLVVMLTGVAEWAARQAQLAQPDDDLPVDFRRRITGRITLAIAGAYAAAVGSASFLSSTPQQTARALAGALIVAAASAAVGAAHRVGWQPMDSMPRWVRLVPRSVAAALLTIVVVACLALGAALVTGRGRIANLTSALGADPLGQFALLAVQVSYLPNLVLWCGSWVLGAGFTLGDGSVVSPMWTQIGLLPGIPVAGAVPGEASGQWQNLAWMLGGVLAGVAAAWVAGRDRAVRFDEQALVGGIAGVVAGLCYTVLALVSRGDLGTGRLVGLGPRAVELAVMAPTLLGLAGMAAGLVLGWSHRRVPSGVDPTTDQSQPLPSPDDAEGEPDEGR
jgi:hypothetical protein